MSEATYLDLKWSVSRGRDTYGYNIATLIDRATGKRYRCNGGGYDMVGTVFGEWLQDAHQDGLRAIADRAHGTWTDRGDDGPWEQSYNDAGLYGMNYYTHDGRVALDGACGLEAMRRIAETIGLTVRSSVERGNTVGFIVTDTNA